MLDESEFKKFLKEGFAEYMSRISDADKHRYPNPGTKKWVKNQFNRARRRLPVEQDEDINHAGNEGNSSERALGLDYSDDYTGDEKRALGLDYSDDYYTGDEDNDYVGDKDAWKLGYKEGYKFGLGKRDPEPCPYDENTEEYKMWKMGYKEGFADS